METARKEPEYPEFDTYEARIKTFADWPPNRVQTKEGLSNAGFFYSGTGDRTICYHCGGSLANWEPKDLPWELHTKFFKNCEYVRMARGPMCANLLKNRISPSMQFRGRTRSNSHIPPPPPFNPGGADKSKKLKLFEKLLEIKEKINETTQEDRESVSEFGERAEKLLAKYNFLAERGQIEFFSFNTSCYVREREIIKIFLLGLNENVKRYICSPEIYHNLYDARDHAQRIELHLNDLARMKRRTIMNM